MFLALFPKPHTDFARFVEKGSQKFKPITKPRPGARVADSRQASTVPESTAGRESAPRATPITQSTQPAPRPPNAATNHSQPRIATQPEAANLATIAEDASESATISDVVVEQSSRPEPHPVTWTTPLTQENSLTREWVY